MEDSQLAEMKKAYSRLLEEKEKIKAIIDRKKKLERTPQVQEYNELLQQCRELERIPQVQEYKRLCNECHYLGDSEKSDEDLLWEAINGAFITPTTNIYCYLATCVRYNGELCLSDEIKEDAEEFWFMNIEDKNGSYIKKIKPSELKEFLEKNIVIYPTTLYNCYSFCNVLRERFLSISVLEGQEQAVEKMKQYAITGYPWKKSLW